MEEVEFYKSIIIDYKELVNMQKDLIADLKEKLNTFSMPNASTLVLKNEMEKYLKAKEEFDSFRNKTFGKGTKVKYIGESGPSFTKNKVYEILGLDHQDKFVLLLRDDKNEGTYLSMNKIEVINE